MAGEGSTNNKIERQADKVLAKFYPPTKIQGVSRESDKLPDQSFFDVWELDFDKENSELPLVITGAESQIALQASLLRAIDQLLTARGLGFFDWDNWKDSFENGFNTFTTGSSPELKKLWESFVWEGVPKSDRPLIQELKLPANLKKISSFKVVQFFPNRKEKTNWIIFSGSYKEIANKIEDWWHQKTSGNSSFTTKGGELPYLKGRPLIKLYFLQDPVDVGVNAKGNLKKPIRGEISFRIMDKTDNDNNSLEKLTKTDLANYAKAIAEQLGGVKPFVWEKGKMIVSYRNRNQGFEGWYPVKSKASGLALITKLLAILKLPIDKTCVKYSETDDAAKAYPDTPAQFQIFGETVTLPHKRPIANVRFQNADIQLPSIKKTIPLVRLGTQVYKG